MKKIDKIYIKDFITIDTMNEWIKEQDFDVYIINVQWAAGNYYLYYGEIKEDKK